MRFMLDTNICIHVIRHRPQNVLDRFQTYMPEEMCISAVTLAELEHGVCKSADPEKNKLALMLFLSGITVVPFDGDAAVEYGIIRASLERQGTPIGPNDMLIAAHAKSLGLPIVTNNTREFERVQGLRVENWI